MLKSVSVVAGPVLALVLGSVAAAQQAPILEEIPDGHLVGTWVIGGADACDTAGSEHFVFNADGSFSTVQDGQPTAVGFWQIEDDQLDLHIVSSPASFGEHLAPFAGQYGYYHLNALLFDATQQTLRMVASLDGELRGANLTRCP